MACNPFRLIRLLRRDDRGVALVELALSLPLLMLLCLGMIDVSRLVAAKIDLEQAAQQTTDYVLAKRPTDGKTARFVTEAASASGVASSGVTVQLYLECDGVLQGAVTGVCATDQTTARYAYISIAKNVATEFNWTGFATMFDGKTHPSTVKVVGDSTVRYQ